MRPSIQRQLPLCPLPSSQLAHSREMAAIDRLLTAAPQLERLVEADLLADGVDRYRGRVGMSADQTLRALVVKQLRQLSYEQLAFALADSITYRAFCRFGACDTVPLKSALQDNIRRISAATLEGINRQLVAAAAAHKVERAHKVRIDSTPSTRTIHPPTDSALLADAVRVLARLLGRAALLVELVWTNHVKATRRRVQRLLRARRARRVELYREQLHLTRRTVNYAAIALQALRRAGHDALPLTLELARVAQLAQRVIDQTHRRVIDGQHVPADDKIVSIFEPDTDILVRGSSQPIYGHKLCLTIGASSMVLDVYIERGNPADVTLAVKMIDRLEAVCTKLPRQAVFDGGFYSAANVRALQARGVTDSVFTKHRGTEVHEMVRSCWIYRRLRRFRAGVEGCISFLKRALGLGRCSWHGTFDDFCAYVWSCVVSANLLVLARHLLT
jgi:transposase, IS5 family